MDEKEIKKSISDVITSSLHPNHYKTNSKLSQLEQLYQVKHLGFTEEISDDNRALTKRIFGTGIRCLHKNQHQNQLTSSTNLVCLGYILLDIAFKDEYVLRLIIEQLNKTHEHLTKMLQIYNPYKSIGVTVDNLQNIMVDIIIKINNWRNIFSMSDILRDYYLASEVYSIFLRIVLCKVNYKDAENMARYLDNTQQIYSILCDYFDLNVIAHRANSLRKHTTSKNNNNKNPQHKLGDRAQVYLFSNYNLFVSTCDNIQFCCGRYYSNQSELLSCQKEIRKSTLEYILQCKAKDDKSIDEEDDAENQDKYDNVLGMSQMELDLGLSSSGLVFSCQQETPYFNSNPETPEFGELLDSARFRKSIDFQTAFKFADQRPKGLQLGTVEEELNSPCSDGQKMHFMRDSNTRMFCSPNNLPQLEQSLNFETADAPKIHIFLKNKTQPKKDQDEDYCDKPRSPPSIQSSHKKQQNHSLKRWDNSRELTFHKQLQSQNMSIQEPDSSPNKISIFDYNIQENRLNIPVIGKKSLLDGNSDLRSQSRLEYNDYDRDYKEFVNMSVKQSQHFINKMQDQNILTQNKKRDLNARKYSVNDIISNSQLKELRKKQKDAVHHSNHFIRSDHQNEEDDNQRNTRAVSAQKQTNVVWENAHSFNLAALKPAPKKMEFISNIVNVKLTSSQKDKKQFTNNLKDFSSKPPLPKNSAQDLRNSKGKRQKSPRIRKQLFTTLTRRLSDCENNLKFNNPGLNGSRKQYSKPSKQKSGDLISTILIKDNHLKNSSKRSPRQAKQPSKFPEFLRNCKSRKGLIQNAQSGKPVQTQSLKLQLKDLTLSKSAKSHKDKIENSLQNSQNKVKKHLKTSPQLQTNAKVPQQQINQFNQQQFQNKTKHTKSQPFLPNTPQLPNKNLVLYDNTSSKPWQYFGSSAKIQPQYSPKYIQLQHKTRQGNYVVSRQSFSSNEVPQKTRSIQYEQPFKNMTSQQNPQNLKPEPYQQRFLTIPGKKSNFNDYAQIFPTQPQQPPLVFNDPSLLRTASFSPRPQIYQQQRPIPSTYSTYTNTTNTNPNPIKNPNQNNNDYNPLELYYSTKTTYNRNSSNLSNFNTSSSMNLTPNIHHLNPMSSGFFHFNGSPSGPPIYPSTPTRQKIHTASSSKVFSTKAESPTYLSMENQFAARFEQFKYTMKQQNKK